MWRAIVVVAVVVAVASPAVGALPNGVYGVELCNVQMNTGVGQGSGMWLMSYWTSLDPAVFGEGAENYWLIVTLTFYPISTDINRPFVQIGVNGSMQKKDVAGPTWSGTGIGMEGGFSFGGTPWTMGNIASIMNSAEVYTPLSALQAEFVSLAAAYVGSLSSDRCCLLGAINTPTLDEMKQGWVLYQWQQGFVYAPAVQGVGGTTSGTTTNGTTSGTTTTGTGSSISESDIERAIRSSLGTTTGGTYSISSGGTFTGLGQRTWGAVTLPALGTGTMPYLETPSLSRWSEGWNAGAIPIATPVGVYNFCWTSIPTNVFSGFAATFDEYRVHCRYALLFLVCLGAVFAVWTTLRQL